MKKFPMPKIIVSKCLEFDNCRYDGGIIKDRFIINLKKYVKFEPVCPEVAIGLGTPRDPIRLVTIKGMKKLYQPSTDLDLTKKMEVFSESYLNMIKDVDGFILKRGSPSCGITNVKIYTHLTKPSMPQRGMGYFAQKVFKYFPMAAIEDESRLNNKALREHFLTKLFTNARFRGIKSHRSFKELIDFHTENKLLFRMYSPHVVNQLGNILAEKNFDIIKRLNHYEKTMARLFENAPNVSLMIDTVLKMYSGLKYGISEKEKKLFFRSIEEFKDEIISFSPIVRLLQSWAVRFGNEYLLRQTLFEPFPNQLIKIPEFEKQRELKLIIPKS